MSRRQVLAGLAVSCLDLPAFAQPQGGSQDGLRILRAYQNTITLPGSGATAVWGFDGTAPGTTLGPALRIKRGEGAADQADQRPSRADGATLAWVRLPNGMDGCLT